MIGLLKTASITNPAGLNDDVKLQPHQADAVRHSRGKPGVILNHGLGSGKTLSSLAIAEDRGGRTLAVTPASLEQNYNKEIQKFVKPDRHDSYTTDSYAKFRKDPMKYVREHKPDTLITDEMHRLRNPTQAQKAIQSVRPHVKHHVGMTASLVNNHQSEVAGLVNTVSGQHVMSQEDFNRKHIGTKKKGPGLWGWLKGIKPGEEESIRDPEGLNKALGPYIHRFSGDPEYQKNLPKVEMENVDVEMGDKQQDLMKALGKSNPSMDYKLRNNLPPSKQEKKNLNSFLTAMRQTANSPAPYDKTVKDPMEHSPKMRRMVEDMQGAAKDDPNFRGVMYSNYLDGGINPVSEAMKDDKMLRSGVYQGSLTQKKRKELLDQFEKGDVNVLGLSPAGAEGIDLKGVKQMQVMEPDFNPETTEQAMGRTARYKSHHHLPEDERKVNIKKYRSVYPKKWHHRFVDRDTSVDEYIDQMSKDKKRLNDEFYTALNAYTPEDAT